MAQNITIDNPSRFTSVPSNGFSDNVYVQEMYNLIFFLFSTLYWSFKLKMAFSVIPIRAVAQANMKIVKPKNMWIGKKNVLRCEASPGHRKVINPLIQNICIGK